MSEFLILRNNCLIIQQLTRVEYLIPGVGTGMYSRELKSQAGMKPLIFYQVLKNVPEGFHRKF